MQIETSEKYALTQQARKVNAKLAAIRDAERTEENAALVGKCFRYRNCYSCPEKPSDYWPLYAKVQRIDKHGYLTVFTFETDKDGAVRIKTEKFMMSMSGYEPITLDRFKAEWRNLKRRISACRP